jgi:glycerol-3-phosphate acyltransferase PlsY
MLQVLILLGISFLIGSFPTSILAGKLGRQIDIREYGSGNAGATNTFRVLGWKAGVVVALIDVGKGFITAFFIPQVRILPELLGTYGGSQELLGILCIGAAVLGHMFPPFAGFKGGKGVGTGAGGIFGLVPVAASCCLAVFILTLLLTGFVSLSSILAALTLPIASTIIQLVVNGEVDLLWLLVSSAIAGMIIVMHRSNIRRLMSGKENRAEKLWLFGKTRGKDGQNDPSNE